jgi:hypothetical protein
MNKELTYEERVRWFVNNYYETGMEYTSMLESMKNKDLDNFEWYGEKIQIPKFYTCKETLYTEEDMLNAFYDGWLSKDLIWKVAKKLFKESLKQEKKK